MPLVLSLSPSVLPSFTRMRGTSHRRLNDCPAIQPESEPADWNVIQPRKVVHPSPSTKRLRHQWHYQDRVQDKTRNWQFARCEPRIIPMFAPVKEIFDAATYLALQRRQVAREMMA